MVNLTGRVEDAIRVSGITNGMLGLHCQHTTAALFVSEFQAALIEDLHMFLGRLVQEDLDYKHNNPEFSDCDRKNAAAHLRSLLLNHSVMIPILDGKPALGKFQNVILAELDGPRERSLHVQILGE
jgi:secondary thiamine-phosphate synthase enzyme